MTAIENEPTRQYPMSEAEAVEKGILPPRGYAVLVEATAHPVPKYEVWHQSCAGDARVVAREVSIDQPNRRHYKTQRGYDRAMTLRFQCGRCGKQLTG